MLLLEYLDSSAPAPPPAGRAAAKRLGPEYSEVQRVQVMYGTAAVALFLAAMAACGLPTPRGGRGLHKGKWRERGRGVGRRYGYPRRCFF